MESWERAVVEAALSFLCDKGGNGGRVFGGNWLLFVRFDYCFIAFG